MNRALLDQASIAAPPSRWDQVPAFARRVRERTGRYGLFLTTVPDDSAELLETLVQMGVTLLDSQRRAAFDSPAGAGPSVSGVISTGRGCCLGRW